MTTIAPAAPNTVQVFGRRIADKWVVAIVYVSALFLDILDTTIVNVAIPALGRELRTESAEWVVLGYTLSLAVWIPTSGWLGDRFGTKRVFLFALMAFTCGSLLCGAAQTIGQLIAFRVIQGIGGGMLTPVGLAMLFRAFPPAERARAAMLIMIPTLAAPALGPVLGGLIVTNISWRWIFLVNFPIGLVALWFGWRHLQEHRHPATGRFDIAGFALSASALALIVYTLSDGPHSGWSSPLVVTCGVVGVLAAIVMTVVELRIPSPMLDLGLLRNSHVPPVQHRRAVLDGQFPRRHVRHAVVPATAARDDAVGRWPDNVSASLRRDGLVGDRRPVLRPCRPAPVDDGRLRLGSVGHCPVHHVGIAHVAVVDPWVDVRARGVHGVCLRPHEGGELRDDRAVTERAGVVDLLDAASGRCIAGCGHHGQHPRRPHVAESGPVGERGQQGPHRCALGVRHCRCLGAGRRAVLVVHPRRRCCSDDGRPKAAGARGVRVLFSRRSAARLR